jgi:hypothetical protein
MWLNEPISSTQTGASNHADWTRAIEFALYTVGSTENRSPA